MDNGARCGCCDGEYPCPSCDLGGTCPDCHFTFRYDKQFISKTGHCFCGRKHDLAYLKKELEWKNMGNKTKVKALEDISKKEEELIEAGKLCQEYTSRNWFRNFLHKHFNAWIH